MAIRWIMPAKWKCATCGKEEYGGIYASTIGLLGFTQPDTSLPSGWWLGTDAKTATVIAVCSEACADRAHAVAEAKSATP